MGACCSKYEKEPQGITKITPYKKRSCTDIICLLVFFACWVATFGIVYVCFQNGDPLVIIHGIDMEGRVCGVDPAVKDAPYAAWPNPVAYQCMICVSNCTDTSTDSRMVVWYESNAVLYYCVPDLAVLLSEDSPVPIEMPKSMQSYIIIAEKLIKDLQTAQTALYGAAIMAVVVGITYILLMRCIAGLIVWSLLIGLAIAQGYGAMKLMEYAGNADNGFTEEETQNYTNCAYALFVIDVIYVLVLLAVRSRIQIAIEVVKEASRAIISMPITLIFPIFPCIFLLIYVVFWVATALYMQSIQVLTPVEAPADVETSYNYVPPQPTGLPSNYYIRSWDEQGQYAFVYHFFQGLWNIQFVIYMAYLVLAGTFSEWYFTPRGPLRKEAKKYMKEHKDDFDENNPKALFYKDMANRKPSNFFCCYSCCRANRFHCGTVAVGSFIIALIQFIRACFAYLQQQLKQYKDNKIVKAIFCMIQCCLKCVQKCMDKINKNMYVWCSVTGENFCSSACKSFMLVWNNLARIAALNVVSTFLLLFSKVAIAFGNTALIIWAMLQMPRFDSVSSYLGPAFVIFLISLIVSITFVGVFEVAIDTIFLCFLMDTDKNSDGLCLAPDSLTKLVGKYQKDSEKASAEKKQDAKDVENMGKKGDNKIEPKEEGGGEHGN